MADVLITTGQTVNTRQTLTGSDDLTVQAGGTLSVTSDNQAARWITSANGVVVTNAGLIESPVDGGRALRFENSITGPLGVSITNAATGVIRSGSDAIQVAVGSIANGSFTLNNLGTILSTIDGQAVDLSGVTGFARASVTNSGFIFGDFQDGVRFGQSGELTNTGEIHGGRGAAYSVNVDGVNFLANGTGQVNNNAGTIQGDRHGINAGFQTNISVVNAAGATLRGNNGSGIGSDASLSVLNNGAIIGAFSNSAGSDVNGVTPGAPNGGGPDGQNDGDGDGIDADGLLTLTNNGLIQGTGAGGSGSDGFLNTSEGVAAGGGSITNNAGAEIIGVGLGILIDDSSRGNASLQTTVINRGTITGTNSFGIRIVSIFEDVVDNAGTITGGGGTAIQFAGGRNTLRIRPGSTINGLSDGGGDADVLDYAAYGSAVTVNLQTGAAPGTGGVLNFENVIGSALGDSLTGNASINVLTGGEGDDVINGFQLNDVVRGGGGADQVLGGQDNDQVFGDAGDDIAFGGAGDDVVDGGAGSDLMGGQGGTDTASYASAAAGVSVSLQLQGSAQNTGGSGSDTLVEFENLVGSAFNDSLIGDGGVNTITGGDGDDFINGFQLSDVIDGGRGADTVLGGQDDDLINGGAGNDLVGGGLGADTLTGGLGADAFLYFNAAHSTAAVRDVITDFASGVDKIDLRPIGATGTTFTITSAGGFTVLTVDLGGDGSQDMQIALSGAATLVNTDVLV